MTSASEYAFIQDGCALDCRADGRCRDESRVYHLVVDSPKASLLSFANGSGRIFSTDQSTDILCSVRGELVHPSPSHPSQGSVDLHVESSDAFASNNTYQSVRSKLIHLLLPHLVDLKGLCIVPNHYVWKINIDLLIVSGVGGSLLDACSRLVYATLQTARLPAVTWTSGGDTHTQQQHKVVLNVEASVDQAGPIPGFPNKQAKTAMLTIAIGMRQRSSYYFLIDPTYDEEQFACHVVHLIISSSGDKNEPRLLGSDTYGRTSIPPTTLMQAVRFGLQHSMNVDPHAYSQERTVLFPPFSFARRLQQ